MSRSRLLRQARCKKKQAGSIAIALWLSLSNCFVCAALLATQTSCECGFMREGFAVHLTASSACQLPHRLTLLTAQACVPCEQQAHDAASPALGVSAAPSAHARLHVAVLHTRHVSKDCTVLRRRHQSAGLPDALTEHHQLAGHTHAALLCFLARPHKGTLSTLTAQGFMLLGRCP